MLTDDRAAEIARQKPVVSLYIGGMGTPEKNFHAELFRRLGYGEAVEEITARFRAGDRAGAAAAVPDELIDEITVIGDENLIRAQVAAREAAGVNMLMVGCRDVATVGSLARILAPVDDPSVPGLVQRL